MPPEVVALATSGHFADTFGMNTSSGSSNPSDSPRTRFTMTWWMWILLFIVIVFLGWLAWNLSMQSAINAELNRIRAEGYPATPAELDAWYVVPDGPNAADVYLEAIRLHAAPSADDEEILPYVGSGDRPDPRQPIGDDLRAAMQRHLAANVDTLTKIHEARDITESRYPVDFGKGLWVSLPHARNLRALSGLCAVDVLHQSESGNIDVALDTVQSMAAIARSMRNEPNLVSHLVHVGLHGQVCLQVGWLMRRHTLTEAQLHRLEQVLRPVWHDEGLTRSFAGERAGYMTSLFRPEEWADSGLPRLRSQAYFTLGLTKRDHRMYLEMTRAFVEITLADPLTQTKRAEEIQQEYDALLDDYLILDLLRPLLSGVVIIHHRGLVQHNSTLIALAFLRYQRATGDLPDALEQLVPDYLDAVFIDTFTGRPLEYERVGDDGFIIFSPGDDVAVPASGPARHEFIRDLEDYLKFQYRVPTDHPTQPLPEPPLDINEFR